MPIAYVFLDNGGVITDNTRRATQYQRLVGEFFAPRFGGSRASWEAANVGIVPPTWQRFNERVANWDRSQRDIVYEMSLYHVDWLRSMFAAAAVQAPPSEDACAAIALEVDNWINPQIDARFPGVDDTIEMLATRYRLYTASDGLSMPLADALGDSASLFERLYGPDLINVPKSSGRPYYDAVFAHAGVDPALALVVDDNLANIIAARETGVRTVLVKAQPDPAYDGPAIASLAALPAIMETL